MALFNRGLRVVEGGEDRTPLIVSSRAQVLREIVCDALEIQDFQERTAFLARACGTNHSLRQEVERLLQASACSPAFLPEQPADKIIAASFLATGRDLIDRLDRPEPPPEKPGDRVGRYRLVEKLGEGGCGTVYEARQEAPIRRRVALKVIKLGMDTREVVTRFEAERQALALMAHPNIARVFDAGATKTGRPYFVMELVEGIRITDFSDRNRLSVQERLRLFVKVCHAVQHAHQKGLVHRDLKPSNVLVAVTEGESVPKVIDFGIAKVLHGRLTSETVHTVFEQFLGTPAYVSPEQAAANPSDIDTRSDIYSLGVLLYELLVGRTPLDLNSSAGLEEIRRGILEREPIRPSVRLRAMQPREQLAISRMRDCESSRLVHQVRGDLDWIAMKCLEKDRARRYATANDLAMDIGRHLEHQPVLACPPSRLYEFRKSVRRHTVGFALTSIVMLTLSAAVIGFSLEANRAKSAERAQAKILEETQKGLEAVSRMRKRAVEEAGLAQNSLRQAYLAQAHALRQSHLAGRQSEALKLLGQAARIRPGIDLRNEAIASLVVTDLQSLRTWQAYDGEAVCNFDSQYERYAFSDPLGSVRVCKVGGNEEVARFDGFDPHFQNLGFSPDGRLLFVSSGRDAARLSLWDLRKRSAFWELPEPRFRAIGFTADGVLAAISYERPEAQFPVRIINLSSKTELASFTNGVTTLSLRFHPANTNLLLVSGGDSVRVWDWQTGEVVKSFPHLDAVAESGWHPSGRLIATTCADNHVRIWNAEPAPEPVRYENPLILAGHERMPVCVSFSQDGEFLLSRGWDGMLRLWDARTAREIVNQPVYGFSYPLSRTSDCFAAFTGEGTIGLSMIQRGRGFRRLYPANHPAEFRTSCDFSADGQLFVTTSPSGVSVWDAESETEIATLTAPGAHPTARFSRDGRRLFVAGGGGLHDLPLTGAAGSAGLPLTNQYTLLQSPPPSRPNWPRPQWRSTFGPAPCHSPFFVSDDSSLFASRTQLTWYDPERGRERARLAPPPGLQFGALSPNGELVAAFTQVHTTNLVVLRVSNLEVVTNLPARPSIFATFSPDNRWFALGDQVDFRVWDTRDWSLVFSLPRQTAGHYGYHAFSPDSRLVAFALSRTKIQLLELGNGQEIATLEPPEPRDIHWLTFSPEGSRLLVAAGNGSLQIWDFRVLRRELAALGLNW